MELAKRAKLLSTAKYLEIIESLIAKTGKLSILKIIIFSYIYKSNNFKRNVFPITTKNNLTELFLAMLNNDKTNFLTDLEIIFDSLILLEESNNIFIDKSIIKNVTCNIRIQNDKTFEQIVSCINDFSDSYLLREVLYYV